MIVRTGSAGSVAPSLTYVTLLKTGQRASMIPASGAFVNHGRHGHPMYLYRGQYVLQVRARPVRVRWTTRRLRSILGRASSPASWPRRRARAAVHARPAAPGR